MSEEILNNITIATFNIVSENTAITLQNLTDMTQIDWGDGTIDTNLSHTYINMGEYECKIYNATSIGEQAFKNCDSLTSIIISDSVTLIDYMAFWACQYLTSVTIGDSVTSIGPSAFSSCSRLTEIIIPSSVTSIRAQAFFSCRDLKKITIQNNMASCYISTFEDTGYYNNENNWENGVLYIGKYLIKAKEDINGEYIIKKGTSTIINSAFANCNNLNSVIIPDSLIMIDEGAFYSCSSLTNIVIPNSVTVIGNAAFHSCSSLTSVIIPDSVTYIGSNTFYRCESLSSVVIGNSVTSIARDCFNQCDNLTSIQFLNLTPVNSIDFIPYDNKTVVCIVPGESLEAYKTAWADEFDSSRIIGDEIKYVTLNGLRAYHTQLKQYIRDNFATLMEEYLANNSTNE